MSFNAPLQRTPANIRINLMSPETRVNGLHFRCYLYGSIFIQFFCGGLRKTHLFCSRMRIGRSRSPDVVGFGTNWKCVCDFLLVINSNFGPILRRFWDTATYWLKIANFPHSHLTSSLGVNSLEFLNEFFIPKTRVLGLSVGEDFVILACVVFTRCQRVTDRRTDIQTDRHPDRS